MILKKWIKMKHHLEGVHPIPSYNIHLSSKKSHIQPSLPKSKKKYNKTDLTSCGNGENQVLLKKWIHVLWAICWKRKLESRSGWLLEDLKIW